MESYLQADCQVLSDGRARSRVRAASIESVIQEMQALDWPRLFSSVAKPSLLIHAAGGFGRDQAPPFVEAEDARKTALAMGAEWMQVEGNHLTMLYGRSAQQIAQAILDFAKA
jgi:hypothetical protein